MTFAETLNRDLEVLGISSDESAAKLLGTSAPVVSRWRRGLAMPPGVNIVDRILAEAIRARVLALRAWNENLVQNARAQHRLFEALDEAMAPQSTIDQDTKMVGGFVSGLDLVYGPEEVVSRAVAIIKKGKDSA